MTNEDLNRLRAVMENYKSNASDPSAIGAWHGAIIQAGPALIALAEKAIPPVIAQRNPHAATFPAEIWLNVGNGDEHEVGPYQALSELSWCWGSIDKFDVRYVRADLAAAPAAPAAERETINLTAQDVEFLSQLIENPPEPNKALREAFERYQASAARPQPVAEQGELLPCPFCGGAAAIQEHEAHTHSGPLKAMGIPDHPGSFTIECIGSPNCNTGQIADTREAVVAMWNQRAAVAASQQSSAQHGELPPLPSHPEAQVMRWSELEKKAIHGYARAAIAASQSRDKLQPVSESQVAKPSERQDWTTKQWTRNRI